MHGAVQQNVITVGFVKEDVLLKWAKDDDEPPAAQTGMRKSRDRAKQRMLHEQLADGFDGGEVAVGDFPVCVDRIPFKLAFHVRDEIVGLARAHASAVLARTRSRMAAKSDFVSGVVGLSAASSSHASSSGVRSKICLLYTSDAADE